jgi:hypothetical protein
MDKDYIVEELTSGLEELGQLSHWPSHYYEENDLTSLQDILCNIEEEVKKVSKTLKLLKKAF